MKNILKKFIEEECTSKVTSMLISEIEQLIENDVAQFKEYTFNRFSVYLNFNDMTVKIEDDLNLEKIGSGDFRLEELLDALRKTN